MPRHANIIDKNQLKDPKSFDISQFKAEKFSDLYVSLNSDAPTFSSFKQAYNYGKIMAPKFGFYLRIKTTNTNLREGVLYKYMCCQRQGAAQDPFAASGFNLLYQTSRDVHDYQRRAIKTATMRCDCRWGCRIIGVKMTEPTNGHNYKGITDRDSDMVWYWDRSDREVPHNHSLDPIPETTYISRTNGATTSPSPTQESIKENIGSAMKQHPVMPLGAISAISAPNGGRVHGQSSMPLPSFPSPNSSNSSQNSLPSLSSLLHNHNMSHGQSQRVPNFPTAFQQTRGIRMLHPRSPMTFPHSDVFSPRVQPKIFNDESVRLPPLKNLPDPKRN